MLFDLAADLGEHNDLALTRPDVFAAIERNFSTWYASVLDSIVNESKCASIGPPGPPTPPGPPSSACVFDMDTALGGGREIDSILGTKSEKDCCGYCERNDKCAGAAYHTSGECTLREAPLTKKTEQGTVVCVK